MGEINKNYYGRDHYLLFLFCKNKRGKSIVLMRSICRGGFRGGAGGGGGADAPPQGFDPLPTQRVPPLMLFQKSLFGQPTLKFF